MRLAVINSVAGYGSTGRLAEMLGNTEGTESRIYYGRKSAAADLNGMRREALQDDAHFYFGGAGSFAGHMIKTLLFDSHGFESNAKTIEMIAELKAFAPDLVHLHNLHGYYLDVEPLFAYLRESGVPVIWTLHDCWAFTGHCAHYTSVHCDKWETACVNCPALRHYPLTFNGRNTAKNQARKRAVFTSLKEDQMTIVTPSVWLKREAEQSFLSRYRIVAIPNGIDTELFCRRESSFRKDHHLEDRFLILAAASNWYKEKGSEDLVRLAQNLPDGTSLAAVGVSGSLKKKLNLPNVIAMERTESAVQMAELYSSADVFINLTQEDTFPTVNIEALACGCPVITYAVGGSPEIVTEHTGIAVPASDLNALIGMIKVMRDRQIVFRPEDCIARGREYPRERMIEEYRKLYGEMTEGDGSERIRLG